jgi:uncharacterized protein YigA (DUF484 family)
MTRREQARPAPAAETEQDIVGYLEDHPEFFVRHPRVLESMEIPHQCGKAVSLMEYQVSVLRDQSRELRRKLKKLVSNARDNEELNRRLHKLTLNLIDCVSVDEVFASLYQSLREDFSAEHAAIRVFAAPGHEIDRGLAEFVGKDSGSESLFASLFQSLKPICGRMPPDHVAFLFPDRSEEIGSGVILPLGESRCFGLLAVASRDPQRYYPGMGVVFLTQLSEIVTRVLKPYLVAA